MPQLTTVTELFASLPGSWHHQFDQWQVAETTCYYQLHNTVFISSTVAAADYHQIRDADWSIQIFFWNGPISIEYWISRSNYVGYPPLYVNHWIAKKSNMGFDQSESFLDVGHVLAGKHYRTFYSPVWMCSGNDVDSALMSISPWRRH